MKQILAVLALSFVLFGTSSAQADCSCGAVHHMRKFVAFATVIGPCPSGGWFARFDGGGETVINPSVRTRIGSRFSLWIVDGKKLIEKIS